MHSANLISLDLLGSHREPITGPIGNYQSHAFTTNLAINPLIAAAMPLLSKASEIEQLTPIGNTHDFLESLIHEVKAFENRACSHGYRSQTILAARYLLCALIDEKVINYQRTIAWSQANLLQTFQHEAWGGERFFIIIERAFEQADTYIDLLELGYICLSLGFVGKHQENNEKRALGIFIDQLYQIIQKERGEETTPILKQTVHETPLNQWRLPPWWTVAATTLALLAGIFIPYQHHLNDTLKPLLYNINHFEAQTDALP